MIKFDFQLAGSEIKLSFGKAMAAFLGRTTRERSSSPTVGGTRQAGAQIKRSLRKTSVPVKLLSLYPLCTPAWSLSAAVLKEILTVFVFKHFIVNIYYFYNWTFFKQSLNSTILSCMVAQICSLYFFSFWTMNGCSLSFWE